jgi:hypothetical protein
MASGVFLKLFFRLDSEVPKTEILSTGSIRLNLLSNLKSAFANQKKYRTFAAFKNHAVT